MRTTSLIAREQSRNLAQSHRSKIYHVLANKKQGTAKQIAKWANIDYHAVMRRLSELVSDKVLTGEETALCPILNKTVTLWKIVE